MMGALLIGIGQFDQGPLGIGTTNKLQPRRQAVLPETHGHGDSGQAGIRRQLLIVVAPVFFCGTVDVGWRV